MDGCLDQYYKKMLAQVCVCVGGGGEYPLYAVNILVMVMHIVCIMTKQRTLRILFLLLHLYYDAFEH